MFLSFFWFWFNLFMLVWFGVFCVFCFSFGFRIYLKLGLFRNFLEIVGVGRVFLNMSFICLVIWLYFVLGECGM